MLKVSLKSLAGHKGRAVATALAVFLGVAFMSGTFVFTATIQRAFDDLFGEVYDSTDAFVRSSEVFSADFGGDLRPRIPDGVTEVVRRAEGVVEAAPGMENFEVPVLDADGEAIVDPGSGPPAFGRIWDGGGEVSPWRLQDGSRGPRADGEVVLDKATADRGDFAVGDEVPVVTPNEGLTRYRLVGIVKFGTADGTLGATQVLFTQAEAQRVMGEPGRIDNVSAAGDGRSEQDLVASIEAALADAGITGVEVVTGTEITEETQDGLQEGLGFLSGFLLFFAVVALVVGAFTIFNTFSIIVAQRGRELALLRAIGAGRRQVMGSVVTEAAVIGGGAGLLGALGGIGVASGIKALFATFGGDIPSTPLQVNPGTVVTSVVVGIVVTTFSSLVPAWRASRIPPVAALRDIAIDRSARSRRRTVVAVALLVAGAVVLVAGLTTTTVALVGFGAVVVLSGVVVGGPVIARPVAATLGAPVQRLRGVTGELARKNATRNPGRTSSTALALTIGVTLVVFISVMAASAKATVAKVVEDTFRGDLVIASGSFFQAGLDPSVAQSVAALPQVAALTPVRYSPARIGEESVGLAAVDAVAAGRMFDTGVDEAQLAALGADGIAVHADEAAERGLRLGASLPVALLEGGEFPLAVEAIFTSDDVRQLAGSYLVDLAVFDAHLGENRDQQVFIDLAEGVGAEEGGEAVEAVVAGRFPEAEVQNRAAYAEEQTSFVTVVLGLVNALLAFSILIAGFGIANTLSLSVHERRHELGLLRAVGMSRRQARSVVRWESVLIALFGTLLGLVLGLFFAVAAVRTLSDGDFVLRIPFGTLVVLWFLAALLGLLAAVLPARRAARLEILPALATQ